VGAIERTFFRYPRHYFLSVFIVFYPVYRPRRLLSDNDSNSGPFSPTPTGSFSLQVQLVWSVSFLAKILFVPLLGNSRGEGNFSFFLNESSPGLLLRSGWGEPRSSPSPTSVRVASHEFFSPGFEFPPPERKSKDCFRFSNLREVGVASF